ncbi:MAG: hydroxymethylbilane synthase [Pelagibacteraceae bacterium TMED287]|nr:MAG: hydroxymethylbilane synthase [Pelagibacteraceae bacterium TMED287]
MKKIVIGSRESKLSLVYANKVKSLILKKQTDLSEKEVVINTIKTSGDIFKDKKLSEIGGKKLFCKEIEENLSKKNIDLAVHALKDMESVDPKGLVIGSYIERSDPREAFVSKKYNSIKELKNKIIGSSSRRRELQLKLINKDIVVKNIRGNIDTRIKKIDEGIYDGIILALAGIKNLKLENNVKEILSTNDMLPAVGQGIIAVQCREEDEKIKNVLKSINSDETEQCAISERSMLKTIGGDCDTAAGGLATLIGNEILLKAQLFSDGGEESFFYEFKGKKEDANKIGEIVGNELLKKAGPKFKKKI